MANVAVVVQVPSTAGLAQTYQAPNTTDTYETPNNGRTVLHVKKTGAGACNVTIETPGTVDGLAVADRVVSIPATTGDKIIGPFSRDAYGDLIRATFSEITGLTFAAINIP